MHQVRPDWSAEQHAQAGLQIPRDEDEEREADYGLCKLLLGPSALAQCAQLPTHTQI